MNAYDSISSPQSVLNEQIARQIFEALPDQGPVMAIMTRDGTFWPSDTEAFRRLNVDEALLRELCAKIDDGHEPIVTQVSDCSVIAAQLATERTDCGYIVVAVPQSSPEATFVNVDLIEILLNQVALIARLIEKNNLLYELQMKQCSLYYQGRQMSN